MNARRTHVALISTTLRLRTTDGGRRGRAERTALPCPSHASMCRFLEKTTKSYRVPSSRFGTVTEPALASTPLDRDKRTSVPVQPAICQNREAHQLVAFGSTRMVDALVAHSSKMLAHARSNARGQGENAPGKHLQQPVEQSRQTSADTGHSCAPDSQRCGTWP